MYEKMEEPKKPSLSEFLDLYPPLLKNTNSINDSKKYFIYFEPLKQKNRKTSEVITRKNSFKQGNNSYPILLEKIIKQQKNRISRTQEVKDAIKNFLYHSNLILTLQNYFSNKNNGNDSNDTDNDNVNLKDHIETAIIKLADSVILEKFDENKTVMKYGDVGHDCYFLLSGRIRILKPVLYKGIKITYHNYLKYLSNLLAKDENCIALKVVELNNDSFFKFHNLENIKEDINNLKAFIKSYCILLLYTKIRMNKIEYTNISSLEEALQEFNFSLKDYYINEKEINDNINALMKTKIKTQEEKIALDSKIKKYILESFSPSEDDVYNMKPYEKLLFRIEKNNNNNLAILYKYETFLCSGPGAFFGEMSLELNSYNKRRNATIRTEEECLMFSLTQKLYNSILVQSINLIKEYDISFIKRNYFFGEISPKNFDKMYFSMFKLLSKERNDIIYKQNTELNSLFFLKEGDIKFEINASVIDIYNLIKYYINYLTENRRLFDFTDEEIYDLNKNYLGDNGDLYMGNKPPIFKEKVCEIKKYEIYNVSNFEAIGLLDFMSLKENYNTSCYVTSKTSKLFEITRDNLDIILNREKDILNDYYKFAKNRFLIIIKRLYSIKFNCLSNIFYKIKENFYMKYDYSEYEEQKNNDLNENNKYTQEINDNNSLDMKKYIMNTDNINIKNYEHIPTSPKVSKIKLKKIKLPYTNRNNYRLSEYYGFETQKNNNFSEVSFKSTKFNENYFIKNKINFINNSFISKANENNSFKSKFNDSSNNSIINTILSPNLKKKSYEKLIPKSPLKIKKIKFKQNDIVNIGKNNFFTLEKLKSKFREKMIDKDVLDLSIVKNENKSMKRPPIINCKMRKVQSNIFNKNSFSPLYFHNKKLKKIMSLQNDSSNYISEGNTINATNITVHRIKKE